MIISHKYKYIFIKPGKVAGTSIEIALAKHCGPDDIITKISEYDPEADDTRYQQPSRNYKALGFYNHITPAEIKEKVDKDIWDDYYKITVVRNPWDRAISEFFYKIPQKKVNTKNISSHLFNLKAYKYIFKKIILKIKNIMGMQSSEFELFIQSRKRNWTNTKFYFDENGKPYCDFYMRYEHLDQDYKKLCETLGIPYEKLPKTKSKLRKERKHYSQYFQVKTKAKIESLSKEVIDFFGYEFSKART